MRGGCPDPKPDRTRFAIRHLNELRKEAGVSVKELCRRIDKEPNYFEDLKDEVVPLTLADFVAIARALDLDPTDVLDEIIHRRPKG